MRRLIVKSALMATVVCGLSTNAWAVPLLQLDIAGGRYHYPTETIAATANPFTLYAIATPNPSVGANRLLAPETFYISAAVSPQVHEPGADLGYFLFNGQRINVTADMTYGKPPIEIMEELQGHDRGDLEPHGIYPTYFVEFAFQFTADDRVQTYDSALTPGGAVIDDNGGSFYRSFEVDTTHLNHNYVMHFDLYNTVTRACGQKELELALQDPTCTDVDARKFAPFSHDAMSPPVPEPTTFALLGLGLAIGAVRKYRTRER